MPSIQRIQSIRSPINLCNILGKVKPFKILGLVALKRNSGSLAIGNKLSSLGILRPERCMDLASRPTYSFPSPLKQFGWITVLPWENICQKRHLLPEKPFAQRNQQIWHMWRDFNHAKQANGSDKSILLELCRLTSENCFRLPIQDSVPCWSDYKWSKGKSFNYVTKDLNQDLRSLLFHA